MFVLDPLAFLPPTYLGSPPNWERHITREGWNPTQGGGAARTKSSLFLCQALQTVLSYESDHPLGKWNNRLGQMDFSVSWALVHALFDGLVLGLHWGPGSQLWLRGPNHPLT